MKLQMKSTKKRLDILLVVEGWLWVIIAISTFIHRLDRGIQGCHHLTRLRQWTSDRTRRPINCASCSHFWNLKIRLQKSYLTRMVPRSTTLNDAADHAFCLCCMYKSKLGFLRRSRSSMGRTRLYSSKTTPSHNWSSTKPIGLLGWLDPIWCVMFSPI